MELSNRELRQVYEVLVLPMGHPDPVGYMTRALLLSGGDPDYWGVEQKVGFMPVDPALALEMVGVQDVVSLQNNVTTTVIMDQMFYQAYGNTTDMIVAFTYGMDAVSLDGTYSGGIAQFLNDIDDMRPLVRNIVSPPRATLNDVIKMVNDHFKKGPRPGKKVLNAVNNILENR